MYGLLNIEGYGIPNVSNLCFDFKVERLSTVYLYVTFTETRYLSRPVILLTIPRLSKWPTSQSEMILVAVSGVWLGAPRFRGPV